MPSNVILRENGETRESAFEKGDRILPLHTIIELISNLGLSSLNRIKRCFVAYIASR